MVSVSKLINRGLFFIGPNIYQDVATPQQASIEQYNVVKYLGGSGPYIQHPGYGISTDIPNGCEIEQIQMLSRHGERFPSESKGKAFEKVYKKFRSYRHTFKGDLEFLNQYEYFVKNNDLYELETTPANSLGPYNGFSTAARHGAYFRQRYGSLYNESSILPVFTSSNTRVFETSQNFVRGFLGDQFSTEKFKTVILSEDSGMGANSLTPASACSAWDEDENISVLNNYSTEYLSQISQRLNLANNGLNLTSDDVELFFDWCAYELNVNGQSPFCNLFTHEELVKYEYSQDLSSYYLDGPGNSVIKPIGSVLVNASLALLKDNKNDNKIWLSFFHDTDLENYLGALGLFDNGEKLPSEYIVFNRAYIRSYMVPQGARLYTEKLKYGKKSYVRFILNDAVIPISNCSDGPGFSCELSNYEKYLSKRLQDVDYATQCKIGNATGKLTFYWDYNQVNYTAPLKKQSY